MKEKTNLGDIDQIVTKVVTVGNSSGIIIPVDNMYVSGLKVGDRIKVWFRKVD